MTLRPIYFLPSCALLGGNLGSGDNYLLSLFCIYLNVLKLYCL